MRKYQRPNFLNDVVSQEMYEKWLYRKATTHVRRDRKRGNTSATNEKYKIAIHEAVQQSKGRDAFTGEELNWGLISKYENEEAKKGGREYKKKFALLPSVDHSGDITYIADFKICSWRTNDAKSDLTYEEFVELCRQVLKFANLRFQPKR